MATSGWRPHQKRVRVLQARRRHAGSCIRQLDQESDITGTPAPYSFATGVPIQNKLQEESMKRLTMATVGAAMGALVCATHAYAETLTVYTAVEAEDLKKYAAYFNKDHPDIKIKWVRDSTGIVTAKLLA